MKANPPDCLYWQLCIDKGCPCQLADHTKKDPKVVIELNEEIQEGMKEINPWQF